jgi:hypothetical protein
MQPLNRFRAFVGLPDSVRLTFRCTKLVNGSQPPSPTALIRI